MWVQWEQCRCNDITYLIIKHASHVITNFNICEKLMSIRILVIVRETSMHINTGNIYTNPNLSFPFKSSAIHINLFIQSFVTEYKTIKTYS